MKFLLFLLLALLAGPAAAEPISAGLAIIGTAFGATAGAAVMTGLMVAGTAISVVGTITGSKKLQRFGSLVGLAGGVGAAYQSLTAAATTVAESAAAPALSQSPVAAEAAGAAQASGVASGSAAARGLGEAAPALIDSGAPALAETAAQTASAANPAQAAFRSSEIAAQTAATRSPITEALAQASKHVGSFIKDNKELVKLGSGLISGAMNRSAAADQRAAEWQREDQQRADYNAGIQSGSGIPFRVNPGVNVTQVPVQDPTRYIPQRGLIDPNAPQPQIPGGR